MEFVTEYSIIYCCQNYLTPPFLFSLCLYHSDYVTYVSHSTLSVSITIYSYPAFDYFSHFLLFSFLFVTFFSFSLKFFLSSSLSHSHFFLITSLSVLLFYSYIFSLSSIPSRTPFSPLFSIKILLSFSFSLFL